MNIKTDSQLVEKLELDPTFQSMLSKISYEDDRYFRQAWVMHQANKESLVIKKWFPILIKDSETGVIGFEFNPGGWKSKEKAGKSKLKLSELLSIIINNSCHEKDTVRCRYGKDSSSDGRNLREMRFDSELNALISKFKKGAEKMSQVGQLDLKPTAKPLFSEDDYALAIESAIDVGDFIQGFEGEEREIIAKCRINQGKFRTLLLGYWGGICAVSGLNDERLLIASHILPWSKSTSNQKGDPFNGLLLSVVWDSLFDKGLISKVAPIVQTNNALI